MRNVFRLFAHVTLRRLVLLLFITGVALIVPISPEGVQGTPLGLMINKGVEAYDALFDNTPPYTVCTASREVIHTPRGPVHEFDVETGCQAFESYEALVEYLGEEEASKLRN